MPIWEHLVQKVPLNPNHDRADLAAMLTAMGADGWELVAVIAEDHETVSTTSYMHGSHPGSEAARSVTVFLKRMKA